MKAMGVFDLSGMPQAPFSVTARVGEPNLIIKRVVIAPDGNQLELVERTDTGEQHIYAYSPAEVEGVKQPAKEMVVPESRGFERTYSDLSEEERERVLNLVAALWNKPEPQVAYKTVVEKEDEG